MLQDKTRLRVAIKDGNVLLSLLQRPDSEPPSKICADKVLYKAWVETVCAHLNSHDREGLLAFDSAAPLGASHAEEKLHFAGCLQKQLSYLEGLIVL
jgi:hypothetical protein